MAEIDEVSEKFDRLDVQNLDEEELETEEMKVKLCHIPSGDQMGSQGHSTQKESYYAPEGTFRVDIGRPREAETHEVGPGTVFAASPQIARGYENTSDEDGRVLTIAAPNVSEGGISEEDLIE